MAMGMDRTPELKRRPEMQTVTNQGPAALPTCLIAAALMLGASVVHAQTPRLQTSVQTQLTLSDNINASATDKRSGWVAEVTPTIDGLAREGGRVSGRVNASFRNLGYASEEGWRGPALALQGAGEVEAIEDFFFVSADASISRSNRSPFSGRASGDSLNTDRRDETRSFAIAPRAEFALGSYANASILYRQTWLNGGSNVLGSQRQGQWNANLNSARAFGPLSWGLNYTRSDSKYSSDSEQDRRVESARATLFYAVTPQLRVNTNVGREYNDLVGAQRQGFTTYGAGFDWSLSPRTSLSASAEDRFFGTGYDLSLRHRMARSSLQLSVGRNVTSPVDRFGSVFQNPLFSAAAEFLAAFGVPPTLENILLLAPQLADESFITSSYSIDRTARAIYTLTGVRNSLSLSLSQSDRKQLRTDIGLSPGDVFQSSDTVKTRSATLSFNHRLSGRSSLNATVTRSRAEGSGGVDEQTTRRLTSSLGYTTSLGARSVAGLTYRHQRSDGTGADADFTENVLTANFGMSF